MDVRQYELLNTFIRKNVGPEVPYRLRKISECTMEKKELNKKHMR